MNFATACRLWKHAACGAAAGILFAGCQGEDISVYRVPKETNQIAATSRAAPAGDLARTPQPGLRWAQLPDGWKVSPPRPMQAATFTVEGATGDRAEVTATPLPTVNGMATDSVNLVWRGELKLEPLDRAALAQAGQPVAVGDATGQLYDFAGSGPSAAQRLVGVVAEREGSTWFFKMVGANALVARQVPAFTNFLQGLTFTAPQAPAVTSRGGGGSPGAATDSGHVKPGWEAPKHWQAQAPGPMVLAAYAVSSETSQALVTVSTLGGTGGGMTANVNRWRRQMGLPPAVDSEIPTFTSPLTVDGEPATVVDLKNDPAAGGATRTIVAVVPHEGMTWFFKLTGPDALVTKEKPDFIKFVQSVRFHPNA